MKTLVVNTATPQQYNDLMKILESRGHRCRDGNLPTEHPTVDIYPRYGNQTGICLNRDKGLEFSPVTYWAMAPTKYKIITFDEYYLLSFKSDKVAQEETSPNKNLIKAIRELTNKS